MRGNRGREVRELKGELRETGRGSGRRWEVEGEVTEGGSWSAVGEGSAVGQAGNTPTFYNNNLL